ncbi:YegP family protein [Acidobacteriota bacterium]
MAAKFEIFQDKQKLFRFRLVASNGQIIATSQGYKSKESCKKGIASVAKNAAGAGEVDTTT